MPARTVTRARTPRKTQKQLERLGAFELKDKLIALAQAHARRSTAQLLNAGRGNPNWLATEAREAFFLLGPFALREARRAWNEPMLAGTPRLPAIARRLRTFLRGHGEVPGAALLQRALAYAVRELGFEPDAFVHELVDGILGDHYPEPVRMLPHAERVLHQFLVERVCGGRAPRGGFDLFATEGATGGICYLFDSLVANGLLAPGDRIALGLPIFTPYTEIPRLERFRFQVVPVEARELRADGSHTWQYPDEELDKLADPRVKAFFVVNPSNPPSVAMRESSVRRLGRIVLKRNPNLLIITDDVYATFVPGYRSLLAHLPHNTVGVYSFSKSFGCTGWRLGVVALQRDHLVDRLLAAMSPRRRAAIARRYASLAVGPQQMAFIDRMAADSRQVALNHTAGLSTPQQVQMALLALAALLDTDRTYDERTREIVQRRYRALWAGLGAAPPEDPLRAGYYADLDLMVWARREYGDAFVRYLEENYQPGDLLFRLAEQSSIVLMPGGGFDGPRWSVRVSLANLDEAAYARIGEYLRLAAQAYVDEWREGNAPKRPARRRRSA
jgi:aspartate 4-decarboxylase